MKFNTETTIAMIVGVTIVLSVLIVNLRILFEEPKPFNVTEHCLTATHLSHKLEACELYYRNNSQ